MQNPSNSSTYADGQVSGRPYYQCAASMMVFDGDFERYEDLHPELRALLEKTNNRIRGGTLRSRQVVSALITVWELTTGKRADGKGDTDE